MASGNVAANGIQIEFETFGRERDEALLLIMGLGSQMTLWDDAFCADLAGRGFHVIRFDNRDVGHSTWFDHFGPANPLEVAVAIAQGKEPSLAYTLDDMADDAAGLLDALSLESAHIVGASMGGMIAQAFAIRHAPRVKSLTSVMSGTGHPEQPGPKPEALAVMMEPPNEDPVQRIEQSVRFWRTVGSPGFPFDEDAVRARCIRMIERAYHPEGTSRQLAAIVAHGSREEGLRELAVPTLVIHGVDDPLVPVECGKMTANVIPGAELMLIDGMGHDFPRELQGKLVDAVAQMAARAGAPAVAAKAG